MNRQNRASWAFLLTLVASAVLSASTFAAGEQIKVIDVDVWGPGSNGGPFEVEPLNFGFAPSGLGKWGAGSTNFITFCIETNETLGKGKTYDIEFNTAAVNGGSGGGTPDPLDERTAFLFTAFMNGQIDDKLADAGLSPFFYESEPSGAGFQDAIWHIEEESHGTLSQLAKDLITLADAAVAVGGEWYGKGLGSVRVLNLTSGATGSPSVVNNQDVLVMIPLPTSLALGLVGLLGIVVYRRVHRF